MTTEDLISIVVPIYNVEDYVATCVESILSQTYKNVEIILVDDGSTDSSLLICKKYDEDDRIRIISQENKGLSGARNTGIDNANGKWIAFVDSDDFIEKTMIEKLYNSVVETNAKIAVCGRYIYDGKILDRKYGTDTVKVMNSYEAMKDLLCGETIDVAAWDKLYAIDLFKNIRYPLNELNEDAAIIYKLIQRAERVVHIDSYEYYYRVRRGSITKSGFSASKSVVVEKHAQSFYDFIISNYPLLKEEFKIYYAKVNFPIFLSAYKRRALLDAEQKKQYILRKEIFDKNIKSLLKAKDVSLKNKLIAVLIKTKVYNVYYYLKRKVVKV